MNVRIFRTLNTPADRDIDYLRGKLDVLQVPSEVVDADSREGADLCELYGVMQRPSVVLTDSDGRVVQEWQGTLPTAEDVSGYYRTG